MSAVKTTQLDGDVSVGRNVAIGGRASVAGNVTLEHNLKVKGWLKADNVKSVNKGIFTTLTKLQTAYPTPEDGWLAGVGTGSPFTAYVGEDGEWTATGGTITTDIDISELEDAIDDLGDDIESVADSIPEVVDNLTTENGSKALSANQGVVLKGMINSLTPIPDDVKIIERVYCDGDAYLDTGLKGNKETKLVFTYLVDNLPETSTVVAGAVVSDNTKAITIAQIKSGATSNAVHRFGSQSGSDSTTKNASVLRRCETDKTGFTLNGTKIITWSQSSSFETEGNIFLGCSNSTTSARLIGYIYNAQIWSGDLMLRDYVPSVRNGVAGLYDKVTRQFCESDGSSDFVAESVGYTLSLPTYGGRFNATSGKPNVAQDTTPSSFFNYFHTNLIKLNGCKVNEINTNQGETFAIFGYDSEFNYVGYSSTVDIPATSSYIRIVVNDSNGYDCQRFLDVSFDGKVEPIKECHNLESIYRFYYEVNVNSDNPQPSEDLDEYNGCNERHYDCGMIYLPTNYDPEGAPVPLVIYCHGTHGYNWGTPAMDFADYHKFMNYNGYAVADCCGLTDKYAIGEDADPDNAKLGSCNPLLMNCINSLYKYIAEVYNIKTDGVYLIGRSTGGKTAFLLPYVADFHVKAVGGMAPAISTVQSFRTMTTAELRYVLRRYGCSNPQVTYPLSSSTDKQYIYDNMEKFVGYDPFFFGTTMSMSTMIPMMWAHSASSPSTWGDVWEVINATSRVNPFPSKIWVSSDDASTPMFMMQMYKKMVDNGNGICYIRQLPDNCGGHTSMDISETAPRVDYETKYKGTINTTVGYAELVDWFNQW